MKNRAFSYLEVLISLALVLLTLLPATKLLTNQILNFKNISIINEKLSLLDSISSYFKKTEYTFEDNSKFNFKDYEDLKKCELFKNFNLDSTPKYDFKISINSKTEIINFYSEKKKANIIHISLIIKNKNLETYILKFKE